MKDRMKATPKDHLFGNLKEIKRLVRKIPEDSLRQEMERRIEAAMSWESLITNLNLTIDNTLNGVQPQGVLDA